ncbi:Isochorismate synthase entC [Raoultella terrigena]|uniref:Isochorismate synthase entC n=1 Tax=Raoultella terrigena TaxID=577 RepID=A0A4V6J2Q1_RAOTE|nr:Isochorismate synthase entC [Raoultella terrigena]
METSMAEDVREQKMTLAPESFFFMSPYRSFSTSGCFRRFSHSAAGGDALSGEFQQKMAAAFQEAKAAGISKPVMVGAIPFDTRQPSELFIPERWETFSRTGKQRSARYAVGPGSDGRSGPPGDPEQDAFMAMVEARERADRHGRKSIGRAVAADRYHHRGSAWTAVRCWSA